jgi:hypothetical protein
MFVFENVPPLARSRKSTFYPDPKPKLAMKIRNAQLADMETIMTIYSRATNFMQQTGNCNQWINRYPSKELIENDILTEYCYICTNENNETMGVFHFSQAGEASYAQIDNGKWLNDFPYGVVHRLAAASSGLGIASSCLEWCFKQCNNIRVDTHQDNHIMQRIFRRNGYKQCGIITLANGSKRLAFQKYEPET